MIQPSQISQITNDAFPLWAWPGFRVVPDGLGNNEADGIAFAADIFAVVEWIPGCACLGNAVIDILGCCGLFCVFDPVGCLNWNYQIKQTILINFSNLYILHSQNGNVFFWQPETLEEWINLFYKLNVKCTLQFCQSKDLNTFSETNCKKIFILKWKLDACNASCTAHLTIFGTYSV